MLHRRNQKEKRSPTKICHPDRSRSSRSRWSAKWRDLAFSARSSPCPFFDHL